MTAEPHTRDASTGSRRLSDAGVGAVVQVRSIAAAGRTARRLADLGLTIGSTATIVQASATAVVLASRGARIALGVPLANAIFVDVEPGGGP